MNANTRIPPSIADIRLCPAKCSRLVGRRCCGLILASLGFASAWTAPAFADEPSFRIVVPVRVANLHPDITSASVLCVAYQHPTRGTVIATSNYGSS